MNPQENSKIMKELANQFGFSACGISKAGFLDDHAPKLEHFLKNGMQGEMSYLERNFDKRLDPRLLVEGSKTVVSLLYNYYPNQVLESKFKISKYAYGKDYHIVVKEKCKALFESLRQKCGDIQGRIFVDSAPILERAWAEKSGIGWIGKHGLLLTKQHGSFFFLAELVIDLECEADAPIKDFCGTCTKCVDACPTDAILPDKSLNASKCISYLNIELKNDIPNAFKGKMDNWLFGCDICQDVCPWNRFSKPHTNTDFRLNEDKLKLDDSDWDSISESEFKSIFKDTALIRTGLNKIKSTKQFIDDKIQ
jgi:epoxyqueuosine reductase